jgi:hypothetical protein
MREDIKKRLDEAQNEYQEILHQIFNNNFNRVDKDRGYTYYWERAKRLQQRIIHLSFIDRERALEKAKKALERAFTPRIKKMLEKTLEEEKEIEDDE